MGLKWASPRRALLLPTVIVAKSGFSLIKRTLAVNVVANTTSQGARHGLPRAPSADVCERHVRGAPDESVRTRRGRARVIVSFIGLDTVFLFDGLVEFYRAIVLLLALEISSAPRRRARPHSLYMGLACWSRSKIAALHDRTDGTHSRGVRVAVAALCSPRTVETRLHRAPDVQLWWNPS